MTKDEAIEKVIAAFSVWECEYDTGDDWSEEHEARDMAIEALATEAIPIEWIDEYMKDESDFSRLVVYSMVGAYKIEMRNRRIEENEF